MFWLSNNNFNKLINFISRLLISPTKASSGQHEFKNFLYNNYWVKMICYSTANTITIYIFPFFSVIIKSNEINQPRKILDPVKVPAYYNAGFRRRCPVCDSSVFSYCSDKLLHDSCCCYVSTNPYGKVKKNSKLNLCIIFHFFRFSTTWMPICRLQFSSCKLMCRT